MPERVIYPEFRDELEFTRYPFADTATLVSSDTGQVIDHDTFLDASLYPIGSLSQLFISSVVVNAREVTIWFSDIENDNICFGQFDPLVPPDNLDIWDNYGRPAGIMVSDKLRLSRFSAWDSVTHAFNVQATELVASCVIPTPDRGLRGIMTTEGDLVSGDIWLIGDNGVVLRRDGDCIIRVDIVGDPLFVRRLCNPLDLFNTPNFVRTVNGCPPDDYGDYKIEIGNHGDPHTIMRINPVEDGLKIEAIGDLVRNE